MTIERIILDSVKSIKNNLTTETQNDKVNKNDSSNLSNIGNIDNLGKTKINDRDSNAKINVINAYSRNKRLNIMIIVAVLGLVFCLLVLTSYKRDLPGEVVGIISTISGIFGACLKDAYSFEFGSSRGSKDKDEKIASTILEKIKIQ